MKYRRKTGMLVFLLMVGLSYTNVAEATHLFSEGGSSNVLLTAGQGVDIKLGFVSGISPASTQLTAFYFGGGGPGTFAEKFWTSGDAFRVQSGTSVWDYSFDVSQPGKGQTSSFVQVVSGGLGFRNFTDDTFIKTGGEFRVTATSGAFQLTGFQLFDRFSQQRGAAIASSSTHGGVSTIGTAVPEPATVALLGIGLVGLAGAEASRRRKKKAVDNS